MTSELTLYCDTFESFQADEWGDEIEYTGTQLIQNASECPVSIEVDTEPQWKIPDAPDGNAISEATSDSDELRSVLI